MADKGELEESAAPHVLLVSFPGQGHVNPLLRLGKRLASKGLHVTFSSSHDIGHKIYTSTKTVPGSRVAIGRGFLSFEFFSDGWDVEDPRRANFELVVPLLRDAGSAFIADYVRRQAEEGHPVRCIINNPFIPWAVDVAEELNIPSAVLWVQSCAVFSAYYHYFHHPDEFPEDLSSNSDISVATIPGLPILKVEDLPSFLFDTSELHKRLKQVILAQFSNIHKAKWVLANSFAELEPVPIEAISKLICHFTPVGPLVDIDFDESEVKGDLLKAADCMKWLDAQKQSSVIYVSVGSVVVLTQDEMAEFAYGLKNCGRPFIWVVREKYQNLLPKGFVEDVKGRAMVVGWSSQEKVLAHDAVACFVTHCGWNSSLELLTAGVPLIAYGQWGDQVTNAKFLVDVYGVGVRLGGPATRGEFLMCVEEVMEGEKAERFRERSLELKQAATKAVAEGGPSDKNIQAIVDEIARGDCGRSRIKTLKG